MKKPTRWIESEGVELADVRAMFESAEPTSGMTGVERARLLGKVAQIAKTPAGATPMVVVKQFAAAIFGVVTAGALIAGGGRDEAPFMREQARELSPAVLAFGVHIPSGAEGSVAQNDVLAAAASEERRPANPLKSRSSIRGPKPIAAAASPSASAPLPASYLSQEMALLEEARRLLATDPKAALGKLDEHTRLFPDGRLATEREYLAVDALIRLGWEREARRRGEALLEQVKGTPYESRVKRKLDDISGF